MYVLINLVVNLQNEDFHWLCFVGRGLRFNGDVGSKVTSVFM